MKYEDIVIPTLVESGVLQRQTLQEFLINHGIQPGSGCILNKLCEHSVITETAIARASATMCNLNFIDLSKERLSHKAMLHMKSDIARFLRCIPFRQVGDVVMVAVSEMPSNATVECIRFFCGEDVVIFITTTSCVDKTLRRHYPESAESKKLSRSSLGRIVWLRPTTAKK